MPMQMGDSRDMLHGSSSSGVLGRFKNASRLTQILLIVNISLGIAIIGFIIGVAILRSKIIGELQEIIDLENELRECEAHKTTTSTFTTFPYSSTTKTSTKSTTEISPSGGTSKHTTEPYSSESTSNSTTEKSTSATTSASTTIKSTSESASNSTSEEPLTETTSASTTIESTSESASVPDGKVFIRNYFSFHDDRVYI
ncbi:osteocalcin 2-like [Macrobrachium rosenbergii]|uniref:osteocalcin 2-like n=1 Tax=Macrobrachium rosenbergii TaxID=79674 RepID=UPI0034D4A3DD